MNVEEFNKLQHKEVNNNIAIDFDGVIHKSSKGFNNGGIYDPPIKGSIEAINWFKNEGYNIIIHTAKVKPDRPLVNGKTGMELVTDWLKEHEIYNLIDEVTCIKPRAFIYIDDRGLRFETWEQTLNKFKEIIKYEY